MVCHASRIDYVVHPGVKCDGCQQFPIRGIRFNCRVCADFDFCNSCNLSKFHGHAMLVIEKPVDFTSPDQLHANIKCAECKCEIAGTRYQCMVCNDYDLCEACETKQLHDQHDLKVIRNPLQ